MKTLPRSSRSGVALIVVMIAIFVLSVLVGAFAYSMKVETKLAINASQETESTWSDAQSGVSWARAILAEQAKCPYDSLDQKWAQGAGGECDTNGFLADIDLHNLPVDCEEKKTINLEIVDLDRFINVNTIAQPSSPQNEKLLDQTLVAVGVDVGDIPAIVDAIKDWIDVDDKPGVNGAEDEEYQKHDPPYNAKNKPIDDLSELLLIRGITREMYSREFDSSENFRDRSGRPIETPEHPVHLNEVWTPLSSGRVNINTASKEVLSIIFNGDDEAADRVIATRTQTPAGSPSCPNAQTLLLNSGFSPPAAADYQGRIFAIKSTVFRITLAMRGSSRKFFAIIGRGNTPQDTKVLAFYWQDAK